MIYGDKFSGLNERLARDYINPNDLERMQYQLHVCESLFGDWNARVCLLMQDAADVESLLKFQTITDRPVLSHNPSAITNKRLVKWLSKHQDFPYVNINGHHSKSCGVYYANAVWYLKKAGGMSAPLKQRHLAITESQKILSTTIAQLQHLELIIAFGKVAYEALQLQFQIDMPWREVLEQKNLIYKNRLLIGVTTHPVARGVTEKWMEDRFDNFLKQWRTDTKKIGI